MKKIQVIDEQGTHYHDTYARRAKQLVKQGRAYNIDESMICLVCPQYPKEDNMDQNTQINKEDILHRMDLIIQENQHIKDAFDTIEKTPFDLDEDIIAVRLNAIVEIVKLREKTNQEMISLLKTMLETMVEKAQKAEDM